MHLYFLESGTDTDFDNVPKWCFYLHNEPQIYSRFQNCAYVCYSLGVNLASLICRYHLTKMLRSARCAVGYRSQLVSIICMQTTHA
jgi:hypothetical protein